LGCESLSCELLGAPLENPNFLVAWETHGFDFICGSVGCVVVSSGPCAEAGGDVNQLGVLLRVRFVDIVVSVVC